MLQSRRWNPILGSPWATQSREPDQRWFITGEQHMYRPILYLYHNHKCTRYDHTILWLWYVSIEYIICIIIPRICIHRIEILGMPRTKFLVCQELWKRQISGYDPMRKMPNFAKHMTHILQWRWLKFVDPNWDVVAVFLLLRQCLPFFNILAHSGCSSRI